jgi:hypothetical protein
MLQKIEEKVGLAAARAEMDVRNPNAAIPAQAASSIGQESSSGPVVFDGETTARASLVQAIICGYLASIL